MTNTEALSMSLPPSLPSAIHLLLDSRGVQALSISNTSWVNATFSTAASLDASGSSDNDEDMYSCTLMLAGGKSISFTESNVPDLSATSYARQIEDLLSDWDNHLLSQQPQGSSLNCYIPNVHIGM
jgi:hypothetical protein